MDLRKGKTEKAGHIEQKSSADPQPVALTLKSGELLNRIYDQGFSPYTMASIARPITNNSHSKPLVSKMYSLTNNLTKEKKQKQQSILFNTPEQSYLTPQEEMAIKSKHSAFMHTTSVFFKQPQAIEASRGPTENNIREQTHAYPDPSQGPASFGKTVTSKVSGFPRTNQNFAKPPNRLLTPMTQGHIPADLRQPQFEATTSNFEATGIGFNQGGLHGEGITQQPFSVTVNSFYRTNKTGSLINPDANREMKNSKLVVDKLRGKIDQDNDRAVRGLRPVEDYYKDIDLEAANEAEPLDLTKDTESKKEVAEASHLDLYLGLTLKNNSNLDEFMYAVPDPKSGNPYKLQLKGFKKEPQAENYTVSGKGLCHYKNGQPVEFIQLKDWLDERETFKKIQSLEFFKKFRKWKTLKRWKKTCQQYKRQKHTASLKERLFISDEFLRNSLLAHRATCYKMSQLKFINVNGQADQNEAITLDEFLTQQSKKRQEVKEKIEEYSSESRTIIKNGFDSCLNKVKTSNNTDNTKAAGATRTNAKATQRITETAYDALGFNKEMSYDQRSKVRGVCMTFLRFSFLVDFIALDALTKVYLNSVSELREKLHTLANQNPDNKFRIIADAEKARTNVGGKVPMFKVKLNFNKDNREVQPEFEDKQIPFFVLNESSDANTKDIVKFNVLAHPFLIDFPDGDRIQARQVQEYDDSRLIIQRLVINIDDLWLTVNPSREDFKNRIGEVIQEGLVNLQAFQRWSKHRDTLKYSAILEEWDDQIGKDNDGTSNEYLNPDDWLQDKEKPNMQKENIDSSFNTAFEKAAIYLEMFREFLQIYWEFSKLNYDMLMKEDLALPRSTLKSIFTLIEYELVDLDQRVPVQADIGLLHINSEDVKAIFRPKLEEVKLHLEKLLPIELQQRCAALLRWIKDCDQRISAQNENGSIQDFIYQKKFLEETEAALPVYKEKIKTVEDLYRLLRDIHIDIPKDDIQLFTDIKNKDNSIGADIMSKNDSMNKTQEVLSKELKNHLIPQLMAEAKDLNELVIQPKYLDLNTDMNIAIENLTKFYHTCEVLKQNAKDYSYYENQFKLADLTEFDNIKQLETDIKARKMLWESLKEWDEIIDRSQNSLIKDIKQKEFERLSEHYYSNLKQCKKTIPPDNLLLRKLDDNIRNFTKTMRIVPWLNNKYLESENLKKIRDVLGSPNLDLHAAKLSDLIELKIFNHQEEIIKISKQVEEEVKLREMLDEVNEQYSKFDLSFTTSSKKDVKEVSEILDNVDETVQTLEKLWTKVNVIHSSRYLDKLKRRTDNLRDNLLLINRLVDEWVRFQAQYVYLENVFSNQEFRKDLVESGNFEKLSGRYKKVVKEIKGKGIRVVPTKNIHGHLDELKYLNGRLNTINKSVNEFLDRKRNEMYRLHFISNDEMVVLLARSDHVEVVQQYIGKLFENVNKLRFGTEREKETTFDAVLSREGEALKFNEIISLKQDMYPSSNFTISIEGKPFQSWIKEMEEKIVETLATQVDRAIEDIIEPEKREDFYRVHGSQPISIANQFYWTYNTAHYIRETENNPDSLESWLKELEGNLRLLTQIVQSGLKGYRHMIICSVITSEVHNRDVVYDLYSKGVTSTDDFLWEQQLRYDYSRENTANKRENITIRQINAVFKYAYEYIGPSTRIVITPLTDKCWITITSALNIGLGAAPAGPAGTGKTESTKDLAKALGRFCIVFNCSEQIEVSLIERLFRGVCYQGAWTCLDEFNRIDVEVLSVIAQQLLEVKGTMVQLADNNRKAASPPPAGQGKDGGAPLAWQSSLPFMFVGKACQLSMHSGFFITMNPGYAGRTELPDNLKVLFRPVAMMIPDYAMIAEILLMSEGFSNAKVLASKMKNLYKLSSEQLSQQKHYDFGMRAVKSVLEMAGKLKRENPKVKEDQLLIKAMRDSNIPKFLDEDLKLFNALVTDLFPDAVIQDILNKDLDQSVVDALKMVNLQHENVDQFRLKIRQLYDTINVRFGSMVIGAAMVGKTTCIRILQQALTLLRQNNHPNEKFMNIVMATINPKSITMGELYGQEVLPSKDWNDGLASYFIRKFTKVEDPIIQSWVLFDGPVDALWIENLNSVLDDSRLLCLANGQRIRLGDNIRLLFEAGDLNEASPATVSRCGMVYMDKKDLGWRPYVMSWIERFISNWMYGDQESRMPVLSSEIVKNLLEYMESSIPDFYNRTRSPIDEPIEVVPLQKVRSMCDFMEIYLSKENGFKVDDNPEKKERCVRLAFILSLAWGFGAGLMDSGREKLNILIKQKFILHGVEESIFNLDLNYEDQNLRLWKDLVPPPIIEAEMEFHDILVPTVDTFKISYMVEKLFDLDKHVLVTGTSGVGKSVLAAALFRDKRCAAKFSPLVFIFSAKTNAYETQETILNGLHNESKHKRSAKPGMKNVVFIDDINMPEVEKYGAQPPIELLRQVLDLKLLYDKKEMIAIEIDRTCMFAVAAPPTGGRNRMTTRFTRHFDVICLPEPDQKSLASVFSIIANHFFKTKEFSKVVINAVDPIVDCTIAIYKKIKAEKLPIPAKFHYTFNLRDVSKIFHGLTTPSKEKVRTVEVFYKLWLHECSRVLQDRLINAEDKKWFAESIVKILNEKLQLTTKWDPVALFEKSRIHFTNIRAPTDLEQYEIFDNKEELLKYANNSQREYNSSDSSTSGKLKLVFFSDALDHFLRILRIISYPRGNAMLVGIEGLGKQSLTKLATHTLDYGLTDFQMKEEFTTEGFKAWLRTNVLMLCAGPEAGEKGKPRAFLIVDNQITNDLALEMINNLLNSGEIPNLFPTEEKEKLSASIVSLFSKDNLDSAGGYRRFIERVRSNLHIVMCMSPIGESLRIRCRQFPALVDCCTIDWYNAWPDEALYAVALSLVKEINDIDQDEVVPICKLFQSFHIDSLQTAADFARLTNRKIYITPKTMLDLVSVFDSLVTSKKTHFSESINVLKKGSSRLAEAKVMIAQLEADIQEMKPKLEEKSKATALRAVEVENLSRKSQIQEKIVERDSDEVANKSEQIQMKNQQVEMDLKVLRPMVEKLLIEIENMNMSVISNMKGYTKPPIDINRIFRLTQMVRPKEDMKYHEEKPPFSEVARALIPTPKGLRDNLIESVKDMSKRNGHLEFNQNNIMQVAQLTKALFPETNKERDAGLKELLFYCNTMTQLFDIKKKMFPLEEDKSRYEAELVIAERQLAAMQAELDSLKQQTEDYKREFDALNIEKVRLEKKLELDSLRLSNAQQLGNLLKDEEIRWKNSVREIQQEAKSVLGNIIVASAAITYFGPLSEAYRKQMTAKWIQAVKDQKVSISPTYNFIEAIGDRLELREWYNQGLPADETSSENAIMVFNALNWAMLIDPQMQANRWIKNMYIIKDTEASKPKKRIEEDEEERPEIDEALEEEKNRLNQPGLKIIRFDTLANDKIKLVKAAVTNGFPLLIEDCGETIDPLVETLLNKRLITSDSMNIKTVKVGTEDIDFHPNFKLFMTTKISNPHFLPSIFTKLNVINFTVTPKGLEEQLLCDVVMIENPKLENDKNANLENMTKFKKVLAEKEKEILARLNDTIESLVDTSAFIDNLKDSKATSDNINKQAADSEHSTIIINQTREKYRPTAIRGSVLYFVIDEISKIDPMYQYSLQYIKKLFTGAIKNTTREPDEPEEVRFAKLLDSVTKTIYTNVSRSLFEQHKFIFSLMICIRIMIKAEELDARLWDTFLRGPPPYASDNKPPKVELKSVTAFGWDIAYYLDTHFPQFQGLCQDITSHSLHYQSFANSVNPFDDPIPDKCRFSKQGLSPFEKIMVIRILRQEKVLYSLEGFVAKVMDPYYVGSPEVRMDEVFAESDCKTPIIFVLSQGADPRSAIEKLAREMQMYDNMRPVSLGQGQGVLAKRIIIEGAEEGHWAVLENCHLAKSWMPELEREVEILQRRDNINPNFRLFLTSMPAPYFPVSILQNGIKLTTEPPRGIRANMIRSLNNLSNEFLDTVPRLREPMHKLNIALCFFHAVVQERRKFGPLGWNKRYEFNDSDLETSKTVLLNHLQNINSEDQINWDTLVFLTGVINYGGRVTDDHDKRLIMTIIQTFYNREILIHKRA